MTGAPKTADDPFQAMQEQGMHDKWSEHFGNYDEKNQVRYSTYDMEAKDAEINRLRAAAERIGPWLSAALDDKNVCSEMKADINAWMDAVHD